MHCFTPPDSFCPTPPYHMHSCNHGYSRTHTYPTNPCSNQNTILPQQIREMKMICFILKIRISNCSLQSVTWELYKLIQMVHTSRLTLELFSEVLSRDKSLSSTAINGPNTHTILQMFGKAIFPTERTGWPLSPRNVSENELGTQVKQQLQDGTVCAILVKFGFVFVQNCRTASTVQQ